MIQIHETVRALCASVRTLTEQVANMAGVQSTSMQAANNHAVSTAETIPNTVSMTLMIRKEITEMEERKKRKDSVIVRGIKATSDAEALAKMNQAATLAVGSAVPLSSIHCINRERGIYIYKKSSESTLVHPPNLRQRLTGHMYSADQ